MTTASPSAPGRFAILVGLDKTLQKVVFQKEGNLNPLGEALDFPLKPYTRYWYSIAVRSDQGEEALSQPCFFETGKLGEPWKGQWLGLEDGDTHPEFQKTFTLPEKPRSARLYICGLGLFEAYINGEKAGDDPVLPRTFQEHWGTP